MPVSRESFELSLHLIGYLYILSSHSRRTIPQYSKKFRKPSQFPLVFHVISGLFEIFRYHTQALNGPVIPDRLDWFACLVQSITNLWLAKTLLRGDETTRPTYQVAGYVRPVTSLVALITKNPHLHRASVKLVNGFAYTRLVIFVQVVLNLDELSSYSTVYARGVFLGSVLSVCDTGFLAGVPIYVTLVAIVTALNHVMASMSLRYVANTTAVPDDVLIILQTCSRNLSTWRGVTGIRAQLSRFH